MQAKKKEHTCFSSETSKVKLLVYLKNGESKTFYSLNNDDRKGVGHTIRAMHRRLLLKRFKTKFNCAIFYCNEKGHELVRFDYSGNRTMP